MDAIKLLATFALLIVPFAIAHLWWWVALWVTIAVVLAAYELASFIIKKKTTSQQFWAWWKNAKAWQRWAIMGGMGAFWLYLMAHLALKW